MEKIRPVFVGAAPLPVESEIASMTAHGLRTWQFLSVLERISDIEEALVVLITRQTEYDNPIIIGEKREIDAFGRRIFVVHLDKDRIGFEAELKNMIADFCPTAVVGVNTLPSFFAARASGNIPLWADLNGWSMTEAQSQAFVEKSDAYLPVVWAREKTIIARADRFSTVSDRQKFALFGELAALGRLNSRTENHPFCVSIPNGNELPKLGEPPSDLEIRGLIVPENAFVLLFSGAYNTWLDDETLFLGVTAAMERDEKIHFVSTGGAVAGLSDSVFGRLKAKIDASKFADRFHFLGWVSRGDLLALYRDADLAINLDRANNETIFGARNRINEWLAYGVPVLSTVGTEVSTALLAAEAMIPVPCGDFDELAEKIVLAAQNGDILAEMAGRAAAFSESVWSYEKTMTPLQKWLSNPQKAPDFGVSVSMQTSLWAPLFFRVRREGVGILWRFLKRKMGF